MSATPISGTISAASAPWRSLSAGELGLDGEELDVLARAAELHDVGKIAIPDAILSKPEPLNEEEWRFIHRHTILGERILMAASALRPVARLVRSSHERFDGGGYPDDCEARRSHWAHASSSCATPTTR